MKDCHWGPVQISGSYKAENIAEATEDRQLWFPAANCLFWLQLQTHRMKASLSGNIYNSVTGKGVSGGAFHGAAEVNLHLVSCSQRLPPDVPCLLQGQPTLGAQRAGAQPGKRRAHPHLSWFTVGIYMIHLLKPQGKDTEWSLACLPNDPGTIPTQSLLLLTFAPAKTCRLSIGLVLCGAKTQSRTDFTSHYHWLFDIHNSRAMIKVKWKFLRGQIDKYSSGI